MTVSLSTGRLITVRTDNVSFSFHLPNELAKRRIRLWIEVGVVFLLVSIGLLTLGAARGVVIALGLTWVTATTKFDYPNRKLFGLVYFPLKINGWIIEGALVVALIIWLVGFICGSARYINYMPDKLIFGKLGYFIGAVIQEWVIQSYCFTRLEELFGCEHRACKWTTRAFAFFHGPNPLLMAISWAGGKLSCAIFRKFRNMPTLALAHGIVGAAMAAFWPHWTVVAGIGFWPYLIRLLHYLGF